MKLFQYITLFFCCGILACSCTEDVKGIPDDNPGTPLQFSCSVASARGSQITAETLQSMGVVGFETGTLSYAEWKGQFSNSAPNFMNNQRMDKVGSKWEYNPIKYWPKDGNVSFFAYAPYGSKENGSKKNGISISGTTLTYDTPDDAENHPDLLIAHSLLDQTSGITLNFQLQHVLACVSFKYTGSSKLTGITLTGIKTSGTWQLDSSNNWTLTGDNNKVITCKVVTDTTDPNSPTGDFYLMLLPQTPEAGAKATLSFNDNTTKECNLTLANGWVAGSRYQYTITD